MANIHAVTTTDTSLQSQKKRTLDALERRFALAEAEVCVQQQKNKRRLHEGNRKVTLNQKPSSADVTNVLLPPSSNASSKKGNFAFARRAATQDVEANDPTYSQLSHRVHDNLLTTSFEISDQRGSIVNWVFHELRLTGDSAQKYMQGSKGKRADDRNHWMLLDNRVQSRGAFPGDRIRALRTHSKRSKKHMSMKQHKKRGSFDLPEELHNFDTFWPIHEMWKGYMKQLLKNIEKNQLGQCLLTADLHGALILAVHCKVSSFIGVRGIMIRETAETFGVITQDNHFRVVPKKLSVFVFQADCWKITLHGDKLALRNIGS